MWMPMTCITIELGFETYAMVDSGAAISIIYSYDLY